MFKPMYNLVERFGDGCGLFGVNFLSADLAVYKSVFYTQEGVVCAPISEHNIFQINPVIRGFYTLYTGLVNKLTILKKDT